MGGTRPFIWSPHSWGERALPPPRARAGSQNLLGRHPESSPKKSLESALAAGCDAERDFLCRGFNRRMHQGDTAEVVAARTLRLRARCDRLREGAQATGAIDLRQRGQCEPPRAPTQ